MRTTALRLPGRHCCSSRVIARMAINLLLDLTDFALGADDRRPTIRSLGDFGFGGVVFDRRSSTSLVGNQIDGRTILTNAPLHPFDTEMFDDRLVCLYHVASLHFEAMKSVPSCPSMR